MILKHFYDDDLAQASYLIGCAVAGEAVVVDPHRDVAVYEEAARREGLRIAHVTETHIHADYVSGLRELAVRTGATMYLSAEGGEDWQYAFGGDDAVRLRDGDEIRVGNIRLRAMHTPGHTPEHLTFLVTDGSAADRPMGALTGDFVFVGDVGRPDLLERAAGVAGTMEVGARQLYRSLRRFSELPDWLQIWPGHGAGSACGKAIGGVPHSALGYERLYNWAFQIDDEDAFVDAVLAGQPEPPRYFATMKRINREGPPILGGGFRRPDRLEPERLAEVLGSGGVVVDTRPAAAFAGGHVPGTWNIPLTRSFSTWAGWFLDYDRDFHLLVQGDGEEIDEAVRDLGMIGLDRVAGYFGEDAVAAWRAEHGELETLNVVEADALADVLASGGSTLVDVRSASEWQAGHIPGAVHIPLGYLPDRLGELPRDRRIVVQCETGNRSAIAASLLRAAGYDAANLAGGISAWEAVGNGVAREPAGVEG